MASKRAKRSAAKRGDQSTTKSPASSPSKRSKQSTSAMGDKREELDEKFWEEIYEEGGMSFSEAEPTSSLVNYVKKLEAGKEKAEVRVLVPFCGMSTDMKWLAEQGYTVVGTELVKKAVKKFFDNFKLKYTEEKGKDFNVFKADDLPLKIYQGDMFKFTSALEPPFNAVWDSHAMHAVNKKDQKRYADTLKQVMAPDCHFLIDSMQYDLKDIPDGFHDHPHPHLVTPDDVLKLFGKEFQLEKLESVEKTMDWSHMTGEDKEAKGQEDGAAKGKGKGKQGKKGQGQGKKEMKYKAELYLMTRKPTKK